MTSVGAASTATSSTSGGAYVHPVSCWHPTGFPNGAVETTFPSWSQTVGSALATQLFRAPAGGSWTLQDAVADVVGQQPWKYADLTSAGWKYRAGSVRMGQEAYVRASFLVGLAYYSNQMGYTGMLLGTRVDYALAPNFWYYLAVYLYTPGRGWTQLATQPCWMPSQPNR